ncbi:Uncharacterized protein SCF082_LOCUS23584 [Durusdinium trenchii]|uniref:Uncharacterized protein n=1 Tax=Durusdinium trenchii TaxID=1381693 RepID=A0ABP0LPE9_9DINO
MRLRRLCEQKPKTKKCHVDEKTREQYVRGGEDREWLEIALVEALQKVGPDRSQHKKLKAEFKARVILVRERMETKEQEVTGQWLTEEKMVKSGDYSPETIKKVIAYCSRFPAALVRSWKYDTNVKEYFVEMSTKQTIRSSEMYKQQETCEAGDSLQQAFHSQSRPAAQPGMGRVPTCLNPR